MSDALLGMLIAFAGSLLTLIVPVLVNWRKNRIETDRLEAELDKVGLETIVTLKKQIQELVKEGEEMRQKMREMQHEIDVLWKALERSNRFIRNKLPGEDIPDFLQDTGELNKKK